MAVLLVRPILGSVVATTRETAPTVHRLGALVAGCGDEGRGPPILPTIRWRISVASKSLPEWQHMAEMENSSIRGRVDAVLVYLAKRRDEGGN